MKKNILLLISLFLLTGCSANYDLTIKRDLSVEENVLVQSDSSLFMYYYDTSKADVVSSLLDMEPDYKSAYGVTIDDKATYPTLSGSRSYKDLDSYINDSLLIREYFNNVEYSIKDGILTFRANGYKGINLSDQSRHVVDNCKIRIQTDYEILDSNSTSLDFGNAYSWSVNKNVSDMSIYLKINTNKKYYQVEYFWIKISALFLAIIIGFSIIKKEKKRKMIYKKVDEEDFDDIDLV